MFIVNSGLTGLSVDDPLALCQLVYTDGTDTDLKGKFVEHTE